jgi:hypothetical protein
LNGLAGALGSSVAELLPVTATPDTFDLLREQATKLFDMLMKAADRETLLMLNPLLARLTESLSRNR